MMRTAPTLNRALPIWMAGVALVALAAACGCAPSGGNNTAEASDAPRAYNPTGKGTIDLGGAELVPGAPGSGLLEVVNPEIPERPLYKEFGDVPYGTVKDWTTILRNVGTAPVVIRSAQAACGCTRFMDYTVTDADGSRPEFPTNFSIQPNAPLAAVPAGGTIAMRMRLTTTASKPNQRKLAMMRLSTDSVEKPYITFEVGFQPTRAFIFAPQRANLVNAPFSSGKTVRIKILVDRAGDPEMVAGVLSSPEGIEAELVTETFGGEYIWYVNVTVPPLSPLGPIRGDVVLRTTGEEEGTLELPVIALVVPDVIAAPRLAAFRSFDRSEGAEFTGRITALVPGSRIKIDSITFDAKGADHFTATFQPIKPFDDGRAIEWLYTLKISPNHPQGFLSGDVIFHLQDPFGGLPDSAPQNELRVTISGNALDPNPKN